MSAKLASSMTLAGAYSLLVGVSFANGCSSQASRGTGSTSTATSSGSNTSSGNTGGSTGSSTSNSTGSSTGSSTSSSGSNCPVCTNEATVPATNGVIYQGPTATAGCPSGFMYNGVTNSFFSYNDQSNDASAPAGVVHPGGCDGPNSCAYETTATGLTNYGGGGGLTLGGENTNAPFNASGFSGLDVWLMGTTTGTRTKGYTASNNTIHVKFVTGTDGGDELGNDDFGFYCVLPADAGTCFTLCHIPFASLTRDGFNDSEFDASTLDTSAIIKIEFEASAFNPTDGGATDVSYDFWVDNVAFYVDDN